MNIDILSFTVRKIPNPSYQEEYDNWRECGSWEEDKPEKEYTDVVLLLNEEPINCFISTYALLNTKNTIDCYYSDYWKELFYPQRERSMFEPFTCSCGVSGCAGIWDGVHMKVRKKTVEWRVYKGMGYDFLPKRFFSFNKQQYFSAINELRERVK
jgi:hypothetical protein